MRLSAAAWWMVSLALGYAAQAASPEGYYRDPAIHGDTIIFTSEGDLWKVGVEGGVAQRLTTHPGMESDATISPDGGTVAFAAQYEGPTEVYVMPLAGGLPTRVTHEPGARPTGWTPDGEVLIRTTARSTLPGFQLMRANPDTGAREMFPLAEASDGVLGGDGRTLFFTRLPNQGSATKRYRGGWIESLWKFAPGDEEATALTADFSGASKNPMWHEGRVYFLSDRDGVMNLWSMREDGADTRQHTRHDDFDIKKAALHGGRVVYQHGADLWLYDIAAGSSARIPIRLASDFDQTRERWVKRPTEYLTSARLSPDGDRVALTARGQIFVAPVEHGRFVEMQRPTGTRYRNAIFLPNGKELLALADTTGEFEFWRMPANGLGTATQVTSNATVFRFEGVPSPDGEWLAWSDKDLKFWLHHFKSGETRLISESRMDAADDVTWSPDSQWIAYVETATNTYRQIHIYRVEDGTRAAVTSARTDSYSPTWSSDGKWLAFLSDRELRSLTSSPWGPRQPDPFFTEATKIYLVALKPGLRSPFAPRDELQNEKDDSGKEKEKENGKKESEAKEKESETRAGEKKGGSGVKVEVDFAGLSRRLHEVPVPAGNYRALSFTDKHLIWLSRATGFDSSLELRQLEITHKDPKPKTLVSGLRSYELSLNRKKLLIRKGDDFYVIPADSSAPAKLEDKVRLDNWMFPIQPREEWRQIFVESWRMMRDYFYDRGMHRLDWKATRDKYLPLLDRVSDRAELSDVIAEMVAELSALHVFVAAGDIRRSPDNIATASLGALLERDDAAGGWRIARVYEGDPDYPEELSPLARPGVELRAGDLIRSINGRSTLGVAHPAVLLRNQAGKQVLLEVTRQGEDTTNRVIVKPISTQREADLRYRDWELSRRRKVEELGRGMLGYVHLRAMGANDIAQWAREYYPVFQRQGLIIDVRHNQGGNIDSWILGKLLRKAWFYWQPRVGDPFWNMQYAFRGHMVVLCNARTASDGEAFTEGFRRLGLGKVIGTRTWGGEIWLSAQRWLVDSGMATAAEIGVYGPEGEWLIEGHGVEPDIVVDNLPHATYEGEDAQLEAAVKHLLELIEADPRPIPPAPRYPDKSWPRRGNEGGPADPNAAN